MNGRLVREAPGYNVFVAGEGTAMTPDRCILEGVTRATVLKLCAELGVPAVPRALHPRDLLTADQVGDGRPAPILRRGTGSAAAGHRAR